MLLRITQPLGKGNTNIWLTVNENGWRTTQKSELRRQPLTLVVVVEICLPENGHLRVGDELLLVDLPSSKPPWRSPAGATGLILRGFGFAFRQYARKCSEKGPNQRATLSEEQVAACGIRGYRLLVEERSVVGCNGRMTQSKVACKRTYPVGFVEKMWHRTETFRTSSNARTAIRPTFDQQDYRSATQVHVSGLVRPPCLVFSLFGSSLTFTGVFVCSPPKTKRKSLKPYHPGHLHANSRERRKI